MVGRHFDALVFDLDGTLVDTAPDILAYLNDMLAELGRPGLDQDQIHPLIGDGVKSLLIRGLEASGGVPDALDLDALFDRYLARYTEEPARLSKPFEGVIETLDTLLASNVKMGVCTNKPQAATDRLLSRLRLDRYFSSVIGGDKLAVRKPHPDHLCAVIDHLGAAPRRTALIGDSETDLKAARAAGTPCILVSFGYTPTPARKLGADHVIQHFTDLIPFLETINHPSA